MKTRFTQNLLRLALIIALIQLKSLGAFAQVGIGTTTPDNSAALDLSSSSKGFLVPRMTSAQRTAISGPAKGLMVFDNDSAYFFYYNGSAWKGIKPSSAIGGSSPWTTSGSNIQNSNTGNVGLGKAPSYQLDVKGPVNADSIMLNGSTALSAKGTGNTMVGSPATKNTGTYNTFTGYGTGYSNTNGSFNTYNGAGAGLGNTTGSYNVMEGFGSGVNNSTGSNNVYVGQQSGNKNQTGTNQVAIGANSLLNNLASGNTATGANSGTNNTSGAYNVFNGDSAGITNTTGSNNTFIGKGADASSNNYSNATAIGYNAKVGQSNSIVLGNGSANVGVGTTTPNSTAVLDLTSTSQGILVPRMSTTNRTSISSPATGLMVYDNTLNNFYYYNGSAWTAIGSATSPWTTSGTNIQNSNSGNVGIGKAPKHGMDVSNGINSDSSYLIKGTQVLSIKGTSDIEMGPGAGSSLAGGTQNLFVGDSTGNKNTTGSNNYFAGYLAGYSNTTAPDNQFEGYKAGYSNTYGRSNLNIGPYSGYSNASGNQNLMIGDSAGYKNTASGNQFEGYRAGYNNTSGSSNTFIGYQSGYNNTGSANFFAGISSGQGNTSGSSNTYVGQDAGANGAGTGSNNTFLGWWAGISNSSGASNTFLGSTAGQNNSSGSNNVFVGFQSGGNGGNSNSNNVEIGYASGSVNTAANNIFIGYEAGFNNTKGQNNYFSGYEAGYSNTTAPDNHFEGYQAGYSNTYGRSNLNIGAYSGYSNQSGNQNVMIGDSAGVANTAGGNQFIGYQAGMANTNGVNNQFEGFKAGSANTHGVGNTAIGNYAGSTNTTGYHNTFIGDSANVSSAALTNATAIGYNATVGQSNSIVLGNGSANVGVGTTTPNSTAVLDLTSTTQGVLIPRMSTTQRTSISSPATGLQVYDNTLNQLYVYNGTAWQALATGTSQWTTTGTEIYNNNANNVGIGKTTPYHGLDVSHAISTDSSYLIKGVQVLSTKGTSDLEIGPGAGASLSGVQNVFIGDSAGNKTTSGYSNTFVGNQAGRNNTTGPQNTFTGYQAGQFNTTGANNTFTGMAAGYENTTGSGNTITGVGAGFYNAGDYNTMTGWNAGNLNTGSDNVFSGYSSGYNNAGNANTALGDYTMYNNAAGSNNVAVGYLSGFTITNGSRNTLIGDSADVSSGNLTNATAIGFKAKVGQSNSIVLGNGSANVGVGTSTPNTTAVLDLSSTTQGVLIPRMSTTQRTSIGSPATGLQVYDNTLNQLYVYNGTAWTSVAGTSYTAGGGVTISGTTIKADSNTAVWNANKIEGKNVSPTAPSNNQVLKYNSGLGEWTAATDTGTAYTAGNGISISSGTISTTVPQSENGSNISIGSSAGAVGVGGGNYFSGYQAGNSITGGLYDCFVGYEAGQNTTAVNQATAIGSFAGIHNTGNYNTFLGSESGYSNTTGINNTFTGIHAGESNTTSSNNTYTGTSSGYYNTGAGNTFTGNSAGQGNGATSGNNNVAMGNQAELTMGSAANTVAVGAQSLYNNTQTGNTAVGFQSGYNNTHGNKNAFFGDSSAIGNTTGTGITALGYQAGQSNGTGSNNTFVGYGADASSSAYTNAAAIGYNAKVGQSNSIVLGNGSANVGVGTSAPNSTAVLDLTSTTQGVLIPRMSTTQRTSISSPATGLQVYDNTLNQLYVYNGTAWTSVAGTSYTAGAGVTISGTTIKADSNTAVWNANKIEGKNVSPTAPSNNQVLKYNSGLGEWTAATDTSNSYSAGTGLSFSGNTFNSVWTASGSSIYNNNSGNIGIGTSSPNSGAELTVVGKAIFGSNTITSSDANDDIYMESTGNYTQMHIYNADGSNADMNAYLSENTTGNGSGFGNSNPGLNLWTASAHPIRFATNATERLSILSNGNIGIGNTSPGATFDVLSSGGKDVFLGGGSTTGSELKFTNSGVVHYSIYNSGNGNLTFANTSSNINLNTAGTANMVIASNGNVGIGTTSPSVANFEVNGNSVIGTGLTNRAGAGLTVDNSNANTYSANSDAGDGNRFLSIVNEGSTANSMAILSMRSNPNGGANNQMLDMKLVNPNNGASKLIYSFGPGASFTDRFTFTSGGNMGIGTTSPAASALLDLTSTSQGLLVPRMSTTNRTSISSPATGLEVFDNTLDSFYFYNGTKWANMSNPGFTYSGGNGISISGSTISTVVPQNNTGGGAFFGTSAGASITSGTYNTALGYGAGASTTNGIQNTFVGHNAGNGNTGNYNTMIGNYSGQKASSGGYNTFVGHLSGYNSTGSYNAFFGDYCGYGATGGALAFFGHQAGYGNTSGSNNSIFGYQAGYSNTTGSYNAFFGTQAGINSTASNNTFLGAIAGSVNTSGANNTFLGSQSGVSNSTGSSNTFSGYQSAWGNTTGGHNVAIGNLAGYTNTTGYQNTLIGDSADVSSNNLNNATAIGFNARVDSSNHMAFGNTSSNGFYFGISSLTAGAALQVGSSGTNGNGAYLSKGGTWVNTSDETKKENFSTLDGGSVLNKINALDITRWMYKGTNNEYHIGPMAQQFYSLFNVGVNNKGISSVDPAGVALVGIQQLSKENDSLRARITALEQKVNGNTTSLPNNPAPVAQAVLPASQSETNDAVASQLSDLKTQIQALREAQIACCKAQGNLELAATLDVPVLGQNDPNPFNESTTINYYLPQTTVNAAMNITTTGGKLVKTFTLKANGNGQIVIPAEMLSAGTYFYNLVVDGKQVDSKKMILVK